MAVPRALDDLLAAVDDTAQDDLIFEITYRGRVIGWITESYARGRCDQRPPLELAHEQARGGAAVTRRPPPATTARGAAP